MTRDEMIAARLEAARRFARGIDDEIDWAAVERRIVADVDRLIAYESQRRDQSKPEREDYLDWQAARDQPARVSNACGGGRRVMRDSRTQ